MNELTEAIRPVLNVAGIKSIIKVTHNLFPTTHCHPTLDLQKRTICVPPDFIGVIMP